MSHSWNYIVRLAPSLVVDRMNDMWELGGNGVRAKEGVRAHKLCTGLEASLVNDLT